MKNKKELIIKVGADVKNALANLSKIEIKLTSIEARMKKINSANIKMIVSGNDLKLINSKRSRAEERLT